MLHAARRLSADYGGRPVKRRHLHLTLVFLGELCAEQAEQAMSVVAGITAPPFSLCFRQIGAFGRRNELLLLEPEREPRLYAMQRELELRFREAGFPLPGRTYRPHVTLVRDAARAPRLSENAAPILGDLLPVTVLASEAVLFLSERRSEGLFHTPLTVAALRETDGDRRG